MAHCAISIKGSNAILQFIRDCIRNGNTFSGSNGTRICKPELYDLKWTLDEVGGDPETGYDKNMVDLMPAPVYEGIPVGSREEVDGVTRDLIAARYSRTDETELVRLKLAGELPDEEWSSYHTFVEGIRIAGRTFKDEHFPKQEG